MRLLLALATIASASCGETTTTPPSQLNFDRPIDVAFACYGGLRITNGMAPTPDQLVTVTAQPLQACNIRSGPHAASEPVPVPVGQENLTSMGGVQVPGANWYGFILQSGPGTVSIAQFATKPASAFAGGDVLVLDADPLTPGKNGISVGEDPIAIATDRVGCYEIVANAGSCDLSALEINSALDNDPNVNVSRIEIKNATGQPVRARPAAMVVEPPGGTIGAACPATPTGIVYVAYPSCHLVAAVDTATGTIVRGIQYDVNGVPTLTDGNVTCPAECGGGGTFTAGTRPVALDLERDARTDVTRLAIGSENSRSLTIVELGSDALPTSLSQIALEDTTGSLGVTAVAIAPQIGAGGQNGMINDDIAVGGQFQFLYAIATDDTIRVADILSVNRECDTQVDPRLMEKSQDVRARSCFPLGGGAVIPRRRPGARGPGIELTGDSVPTSIEIFRSEESGHDDPGPARWIGYYGIITSTSGATYVLNVDDDDYLDLEDSGSPLAMETPLAIAHQLRDAIPRRNLLATTTEDGMEKLICETDGPDPDVQGSNIGGPRAVAPPTRTVPAGVIAPEKAPSLPNIRQVTCTGNDTTKPVSELVFAAPEAVRDFVYRDLRSLRDEQWTLTWEGSLSLDTGDADLDGPAVRIGQMAVDGGGMRMLDATQPYCDAGVEPWDIVQIRGCDPSVGDAQCPVGYKCFVHPNSQVAGLGACMLADEADRLADACKDFLTSLRRYTVVRAASGELRIAPRKSVLPTTPIDGCVDDAQCKALADFSAELGSSAHPVDDMTAPNPRTFVCRADPDRAPLDGPGQTGKRCIETCTATQACATGRICRIAPGQTEGYCMEGITPPQACVNSTQRYELRAHEAFAVVGSRSGYVHATIREPNSDRCIRDPNAHPFEIGRLPLGAPACDPTADPLTGQRPDGTYEPNPCSLTVDQTELAPNYTPGTCSLADPTTTMITRQAPAIRFRNRGLTMTMVDPTYPGDATCIRDRMGTLGRIPLVFAGYQLSWRQAGGFAPLTLALSSAALPVKVVRGPTESIWVIDHGDFLSTSITQPSTRGKVFRIEPSSPGLVNLLE